MFLLGVRDATIILQLSEVRLFDGSATNCKGPMLILLLTSDLLAKTSRFSCKLPATGHPFDQHRKDDDDPNGRSLPERIDPQEI
jgi:hypothetical protein